MSLETVTRATSLYQSMSPEEQHAYLVQCGLVRCEDASAGAGSGSLAMPGSLTDSVGRGAASQHEVNRLVVSPAGNSSPTGRNGRVRAHEALRLVHDDNTISDTYKGQRMIVASAVPRTDEDVRLWFQSLVGSDDPESTLEKDAFRRAYLSLDSFGVPPRVKWLEEQLGKIKTADDRIAFSDFRRLMGPLVSQ